LVLWIVSHRFPFILLLIPTHGQIFTWPPYNNSIQVIFLFYDRHFFLIYLIPFWETGTFSLHFFSQLNVNIQVTKAF
jgi:hypothetical protein